MTRFIKNSRRQPNAQRRSAGIQRLAVRLPCVYILASRRNGTLYVGVTADLGQRVWQHKSDLTEGFTKRYGVHTLVWYEVHESMESAIRREKAIKEWKRAWKLELIEKELSERGRSCTRILSNLDILHGFLPFQAFP